jgi:hypothetical protein
MLVDLGLRRTRGRIGDQAEFQIGKLVQDAFGVCTVLDPGQIDYDAVAAQSLHQRFRDTQFVDPVTQALQVLSNGVVLDLAHLVFAKREPQPWPAIDVSRQPQKVCVCFLDGALGAVSYRGVQKSNVDACSLDPVGARHVAQALVAKNAANIVLFVGHAVGKGLIHVDFQQEVHASRQIEAVGHGLGA